MEPTPISPLSRLVFFMICLSVAGIMVAGIHYLALDLPQQNAAPPAPANGCLPSVFLDGCTYYSCPTSCCTSRNEMHSSNSCCYDEHDNPEICQTHDVDIEIFPWQH